MPEIIKNFDPKNGNKNKGKTQKIITETHTNEARPKASSLQITLETTDSNRIGQRHNPAQLKRKLYKNYPSKNFIANNYP